MEQKEQGKRKFYNPNKLKQIVISVNEVMEYTAVRKLVNGKLGLVDNIDENELFYFWEVYILYRILRDLKENHIKIYSSLHRDSHDFMKHFEESKPGFIEFLKGLKGTAGVKFDISNPNIPIPDFYISAEGNKVEEEQDKKLPIILIDTIKSDICSKLRRFKSVIYVLVDNLDDFSSREEFDAQKQVIQGLVETCKYYTKFPEVKIKASLRPELYGKLNFSKLGGRDKVEPRVVHIKWKSDDIRRFIAERLLVNIEKHCVRKKKNLQIFINEKDLFRLHRPSEGVLNKLLWRVKDYFSNEIDIRDAREIDLKDQIYKDIITSLFPRKIKHFNSNGKKVDGLDIFHYLSSHFCFANNNATPRIYLRFLDKVFSVAYERSLKNESQTIKLDSNNEYPLIKREFILSAYSLLQTEVRDNFISSVDYEPWKRKLSMFFEKRGKKHEVTYSEIKKWIGESDVAMMRDFLAYCTHLGVLHCENRNSSLENRSYSFSILFQKNVGLTSTSSRP